MRIFKNKTFNKWARGVGLTADDLRDAAEEMAAGNTGSSLGRKVFKKRIALSGRGKSGSTRAIIGFELGGNRFVIYGYAKSEQTNITQKEKAALQKIAKTYLAYTDKELDKAVNKKALIEVKVKDDG